MAATDTASTNTFVTVSGNDHSADVWIAVLFSCCCTTVTLLFRLYRKVTKYYLDDYLLVAAQLVAWSSYAAAVVALLNGLGKSTSLTSTAAEQRQARALRAYQCLLIVSLGLSTSSTIALIHRVFTTEFKASGITVLVLYKLNAIWCLASIVATSAGCSPKHIFHYTDPSLCPGDAGRWTAVYSVSIFIEISIAVCPIIYVSLLQAVSFKRRVAASFAFLIRLPAVPLAIFYILTYQKWAAGSYSKSDDTTDWTRNKELSVVLPLVFQQCHLGWSLIGASLPIMRSFVRSFSRDGITYYEPPKNRRVRIGSDAVHSGGNSDANSSWSPISAVQTAVVRGEYTSQTVLCGQEFNKKRLAKAPVMSIMDDPSRAA